MPKLLGIYTTRGEKDNLTWRGLNLANEPPKWNSSLLDICLEYLSGVSSNHTIITSSSCCYHCLYSSHTNTFEINQNWTIYNRLSNYILPNSRCLLVMLAKVNEFSPLEAPHRSSYPNSKRNGCRWCGFSIFFSKIRTHFLG